MLEDGPIDSVEKRSQIGIENVPISVVVCLSHVVLCVAARESTAIGEARLLEKFIHARTELFYTRTLEKAVVERGHRKGSDPAIGTLQEQPSQWGWSMGPGGKRISQQGQTIR